MKKIILFGLVVLFLIKSTYAVTQDDWICATAFESNVTTDYLGKGCIENTGTLTYAKGTRKFDAYPKVRLDGNQMINFTNVIFNDLAGTDIAIFVAHNHTGGNVPIVATQGSVASSTTKLLFDGGNWEYTWENPSGSSARTGSITILESAWQVTVWEIAPSIDRHWAYVNNTLDINESIASASNLSPSTRDLTFGGQLVPYWSGEMQDICVINISGGVLSQAELDHLYESGCKSLYENMNIKNTTAFTREVVETTTQRFIFTINYTGSSLDTTNVSADLIYNNTVYNLSKSTVTNYVNFTTTLTVPYINNLKENISFYINYTLDGVDKYNTTTDSQEVSQMFLGKCNTSINVSVYNLTIRDEESDVLVSSTLNAHFKMWEDDVNLYRNYTFNYTGVDSVEFCMELDNEDSYVDSLFQYEATDYEQRTYYLVNETLSNVTRFDTTYLLTTTNATAVNLYLTDTLDDELADYYAYLLRKDFATNTYKTVEVRKTDIDGYARFNLILDNAIYRWIFKDKGGDIKQQTEDNTISLTTLYYDLNLETDFFQKFSDIKGMAGNVTIDNATGVITFTYSDSSTSVDEYCLKVEEYKTIATQTLSDTCSTAKTGTLTYTIPDTTQGTYTAIGYVKTTGSPTYETPISQSLIKYGGAYRTFGALGLIASVLWTMALTSVGAMLGGLGGMVIFGIIGLGSSVIVQFIWVEWFILISIIILGGVVVWKVRG